MNRRPLLVIFLTVFIDLVGFGIIIPLSPFLAREYGASAFQVGLLMAIFSFFQFAASPFWGRLSDRIGRRPVLLLSIGGTVLAHLLFYYSTSLAGLFVARALAGFFGANISTAMAYIADVTGAKDRSKNMGLIGAAFGLGFICGPAIGGLLSVYGEQLPALAAAGISAFNLILAGFYLKESLPLEKRGLQTGAQPSRLKNIFEKVRRPVVGTLLFTQFGFGLAMANMEANLFLYVQDRFGWDMRTASYGFAYVGVWIVITQGFLVRKLLPKIGERVMLVFGLGCFGVSLFGVGLSDWISVLALSMTLLALGNGLINPSLTGSLSLLTPSTEQGEVIGVNQSMAALARIVGPPLGGWLYTQFDPRAPFFFGGVIALLTLAAIWRVRTRLPDAARTAAN